MSAVGLFLLAASLQNFSLPHGLQPELRSAETCSSIRLNPYLFQPNAVFFGVLESLYFSGGAPMNTNGSRPHHAGISETENSDNLNVDSIADGHLRTKGPFAIPGDFENGASGFTLLQSMRHHYVQGPEDEVSESAKESTGGNFAAQADATAPCVSSCGPSDSRGRQQKNNCDRSAPAKPPRNSAFWLRPFAIPNTRDGWRS